MQRVTRSNAVAVQPAAPASPGPPGFFSGGNPGGGIAATTPGFEWFNTVQEELVGVVLRVFAALDAGDQAQLRKAIERLAGAGVTFISASGTLNLDQVGLLLVSAAGGNVTLTLPAANAMVARPIRYIVVRTDSSANTLTVQRAGGNTIEGQTSITVPVGGRRQLISDGATTWRDIANTSGRLIGVQRITASGTYTPTPGTSRVIVRVQGGGGAGGGAPAAGAGQVSLGGAGGSGSLAVEDLASGFAGATVTVGAGGVAAAGVAGGNGGASAFGAVTAPGGIGGSTIAPVAPPWSTGGGAGGAAPTGGNILATGGQQAGVSQMLGLGVGHGGAGAMSPIGGAGGSGPGAGSNGNAAVGPGAGGSGTAATAGQGPFTGGNGAPGIVIVEEYA